MNEENDNCKIDCQQFKEWLMLSCSQDQERKIYNLKSKVNELLQIGNIAFNAYTNNTTDGKTAYREHDNTVLNLRTYICANGKCKYNNDRKHRRITNYNYRKMTILYTKINPNLDTITNDIINLWRKDIMINNNNIKFIDFVQENTKISERKIDPNVERYKPIESIFNKIEDIVLLNNEKIRNKEDTAAPGQKILKINENRMTYGDINYLGNNKAIFYFNRGIRGIQMYTNSVYSIKYQPPHKDIVIIDDIVFTSNCKCDSALQHRSMFPHYRVTCAKGLTCPARFNNIEKIIYARDKNATTEAFTTARAMLVRFW